MVLSDKQDPVFCIMGPTASGKSQLGVELATRLQGEIISVDSALVYQGMDIGTAKPSLSEMQGIPHHLIDINDPKDAYSVADFRRDVIALIGEIQARGNRAILVGGTMLYFKALKDGLAAMPAANQTIRDEIIQQAEENGWQAVHLELSKVDPKAAARINPNDPQRLQRALEVFRVSGKSLSDWQAEDTEKCPFHLKELAILPPDRSVLHARIEARFQKMLDQGFQSEVERLFARGDLVSTLPSIKSVGYRQMWAYLSGDLDRQGMVDKAIVATRQLAKRQYTWLRGWQDLRSLPEASVSEALKILN